MDTCHVQIFQVSVKIVYWNLSEEVFIRANLFMNYQVLLIYFLLNVKFDIFVLHLPYSNNL